ncbi:MAG: DinB family protein [bacterium]|nr:DinB family protein [bacterium]
MHTSGSLLDLHERTHHCLKVLLDHCRGFTAEELHRELPGFGYPSVQLQLHHVIGAQRYWLGVLQGRIDADEDAPDFPTIEALERFRGQVFAATEAYLRGVTAAELAAARPMMTWGNREKTLAPQHVVLRVLTHVFHHQGQLAAMCRLLGRPCEGLDYPLD